VRGRGLLIALEFSDEIAQDVVMACVNKGLLVNKVKPNAIRLMPPLIITENEVDEAAGILHSVFKERESRRL
jgi:acetylornithine/succinyldiaminopimelate/putrescine aminotransferase